MYVYTYIYIYMYTCIYTHDIHIHTVYIYICTHDIHMHTIYVYTLSIYQTSTLFHSYEELTGPGQVASPSWVRSSRAPLNRSTLEGFPWENHVKSRGKPWETHGKPMDIDVKEG